MIKQATGLSEAKQQLIDNRFQVKSIGNYGYVALKGFYGSDDHICEVARLTSGSKGKDNESLIRYLLRKRHTSPFEFCNIEFEVALPIFVERQWIRHRTGKTNEVSARYSQLPGEVWELPTERIVYAPEANHNRQGSGNNFPESEHEFFIERYNFVVQNAVNTYNEFMGKGMAPEVARAHLPLGTYTRKRWQCDLHNLLHFLGLRVDPHAQKEIRDYANAVADFVKELFPVTFKAFEDYRLNSVSFSAQEIKILADYLRLKQADINTIVQTQSSPSVKSILGKTEILELESKLKRFIVESDCYKEPVNLFERVFNKI